MEARRTALHRHHQVLVVEDCPDFRESLVCLLTVHGCHVVSASSGPEAFEKFAGGLRPCVMLLDLRMPEMDGWEVWQRMKANDELAKTPVILLSGDTPESARARALGIRAFLQKTKDVVKIADVVERHCRASRSAA